MMTRHPPCVIAPSTEVRATRFYMCTAWPTLYRLLKDTIHDARNHCSAGTSSS
jgi:hypothetical protein